MYVGYILLATVGSIGFEEGHQQAEQEPPALARQQEHNFTVSATA
jgi:hypothetical protein